MELNLPVLIAAGVGSLLMGIGLGMFIAIVWYENKGIRRILGSSDKDKDIKVCSICSNNVKLFGSVEQTAIPDSQRHALNSRMFNDDGDCLWCGQRRTQHDRLRSAACRVEYENAQQAKAKLS